MAKTSDTTMPTLGTLLKEHRQRELLSRELIRLSICARTAQKDKEALAAERAAEECIAMLVQLEEQLKAQL